MVVRQNCRIIPANAAPMYFTIANLVALEIQSNIFIYELSHVNEILGK